MVPSSPDSFEKSRRWKPGCHLNFSNNNFLKKKVARRLHILFLGIFEKIYNKESGKQIKFQEFQNISKLLQTVTKNYYKETEFITNCDRYCKIWYDKRLLQSVAVITKCDNYYKVRRNTFL